MKNIHSSSRRKTLWSDLAITTPLQQFIDECNQGNYARKHPRLDETTEPMLFNSYAIEECRHCKSSGIQGFGFTRNGIRRYRCKECGRTFTVITGTIFGNHKIPISEWLDFLLSVFGYGRFNLVSKANRNAYNTTRYWIEKVFLVLREYQSNIILGGDVQLDETYIKVRGSDIQTHEDGKEYRGIHAESDVHRHCMRR